MQIFRGGLNDIKQGGRTLFRSRGRSAAIILTLGLAVAASASVFAVFDALFIDAIPYRESDRLVRVHGTNPARGLLAWVSPPDLADIRRDSGLFDEVGGVKTDFFNVRIGGSVDKIETAVVTEGFLPAMGIDPVAGRLFGEHDFTSSGPTVALVSEELWRSRFASDPGIMGASVTLEGIPFSIVGILPTAIDYPSRSVGLWIPLITDESRGSRSLVAVGRLREGLEIEDARRNLASFGERLEAEYADFNADRGLTLVPLQESIVGDYARALSLLQIAALFVLLIACANVAGIVGAGFLSREREIAVRATLGANRSRLMRQLFVELALLGAVSAAVGLLLAHFVVGAIIPLVTWDLPQRVAIDLDVTVVGFATTGAMLATLLAGLFPVLRMTSNPRVEAFRTASSSESRRRGWQRMFLVAATLALSLALLTTSASLIKSLWLVLRIDPGINARHLTTFKVSLPESRYESLESRRAYLMRARNALEEISGVDRVGTVSMQPFSGDNLCVEFGIDGVEVPASDCGTDLRVADRAYFEAAGISLVRGRLFDERDFVDSPGVAVVSLAFARSEFGAEDPLGHTIEIADRSQEIIGVVADVRQFTLDREPEPLVYLSMGQRFPGQLSFNIQSELPLPSLAVAIREAMAGVDGEVAVERLTTAGALIDETVAPQKFRMILVTGFAWMALAIAIVGLYGAFSRLVLARFREIGIRMALGASTGHVASSLFRQAGWVVGGGLGGGLVLSALAGRSIEAWLFRVSPLDLGAMSAAATVIVVTALGAIALPALRATRLDPARVLREE